MEKVNFLYIGRYVEILETVVRLINNNDNWNGIGVFEDALAKLVFNNMDVQIVLLGCGIEEEDENILRDFFTQTKPLVKIIQHYGGGSGLLYNEITTALGSNTITPNLS